MSNATTSARPDTQSGEPRPPVSCDTCGTPCPRHFTRDVTHDVYGDVTTCALCQARGELEWGLMEAARDSLCSIEGEVAEIVAAGGAVPPRFTEALAALVAEYDAAQAGRREDALQAEADDEARRESMTQYGR